MAKGSVRKKGKKWYYRFYVEDESGNRIQKELPGTENKNETESLLRKAMEEYENQKFISKAANLTLNEMLDMWIAEELKPSGRSNGTERSYVNTVNCVKKHSIGKRKLKLITAEHLQAYFDSLCVDGTFPDGSVSKALTIGTIHVYASVLRNAFRFAVFPKRLITFNPMQYVVLRNKTDNYEMFVDSEQAELVSSAPIVSQEQFQKITESLKTKNNPALLPIQIAYYTGLRIGEVCALTWQDIDLKEQYLTVRRSVSYNNTRHKTEIGPTKRKKIRTVDFCDTLAEILKKAKIEQQHNRKQYGELHSKNYYIEVVEKSRSYFELYSLGQPDVVPEGYKELSLVCTKPDGSYESVRAVTSITKSTAKKVAGIEDFHFHLFRHTYTSNLLSRGATPKDVQELLGHSDVSTTMNIYAHATRDSKKASARLLDQSTVSA